MVTRRRHAGTAWAALVVVGALLAGIAVVAGPAGANPEPAGPDRAEVTARSAASEAAMDLAAEHGVGLDRAVLEELDAAGTTDFWVELDDRADLSEADRIADWAAGGGTSIAGWWRPRRPARLS